MIVIFDWDGTLCDSVDGIVLAMRAAAAELDIPPPADAAVRNIVGLGLPQAVGQLFPALDDGERQAVTEAYSRLYVEVTAGPATLFEGARDMLAELRGRGFELAVATGKSRRGLGRVLGGIGMGDYFDSTRCADETASKPDPLMLEQILAERGKSVAEAVMVGDSEYDLDMAARAGMASIGVSFGVHPPGRLSRHRPRHIVDHLSELPALLGGALASGG
ncbi:HAD family hydrolase [Parahaliea mediterranea]|uniref:HAD-IA family hydrolase n=1 Tax=Parahaliea mediterranea TaxID=651086 RepID=A0A939IKV4_9GAMM|nr:HAD-IA family hydrolase [Parahaliea mediterranea]MBN7797731.1 HAD-IA family hydrolase [Parahaliea mediterranea]